MASRTEQYLGRIIDGTGEIPETPISRNEALLAKMADGMSHETWTFTLDDDTTVTKEVIVWTSQE